MYALIPFVLFVHSEPSSVYLQVSANEKTTVVVDEASPIPRAGMLEVEVAAALPDPLHRIRSGASCEWISAVACPHESGVCAEIVRSSSNPPASGATTVRLVCT